MIDNDDDNKTLSTDLFPGYDDEWVPHLLGLVQAFANRHAYTVI